MTPPAFTAALAAFRRAKKTHLILWAQSGANKPTAHNIKHTNHKQDKKLQEGWEKETKTLNGILFLETVCLLQQLLS